MPVVSSMTLNSFGDSHIEIGVTPEPVSDFEQIATPAFSVGPVTSATLSDPSQAMAIFREIQHLVQSEEESNFLLPKAKKFTTRISRENTQFSNPKSLYNPERHLFWILLSMTVSLICVFVSVYFVGRQAGFVHITDDYFLLATKIPTKAERSAWFETIYDLIIPDILKKLWKKERPDEQNILQAENSTGCFQRVMGEIVVSWNITYSNPILVTSILKEGLLMTDDDITYLPTELQTATKEPISLLPLYEKAFACGSEYPFFNELACAFEADSSPLLGFYPLNHPNPQTGLTGTQRLSNWWFVVQKIVAGCLNDPLVTGSWFQRHFLSRNIGKILNKLRTMYDGYALRFLMMKFWTIMTNVENQINIHRRPASEDYWKSSRSVMQLNILEAVWNNLNYGDQSHTINAYHGLDIIRDLTYDYTLLGEGSKVQSWLSPHWIKSYITWNLAYVASFRAPPIMVLILTIPNQICLDMETNLNWLDYRLISLALSLLSPFEWDFYGGDRTAWNPLSSMLTNLAHHYKTVPDGTDLQTKEIIKNVGFQYEPDGRHSLFWMLNDRQFQRFMTIVLACIFSFAQKV